MKQAVILAAGRGTRLGEGLPKCLVRLGGRALIHHQLDVLHGLGVEDVCVVVGYGAERVRSVVGEGCHYVENRRFAETNSLYSLWLAREWVRGPFLQLNCDLIAHPRVYERLLSTSGSALAYDSGSGHDDEHMKVVVRRGLLQDIGKKLEPGRSCGENRWSPAAMARLAQRVPVRCIDVAGLPWTEIDFVEDILYAQCEVLPELCSGQARPQGDGRGLPTLAVQVMSALSSMGGIYECLP